MFHQPTPAQGRRLAEQLIQKLPSCPIPEIARLGKTLRRWKTAFLAYFDTDGASNGGTEAVNGVIELGRRIARGFRNFEHYRLRMLLITGGLDASPHINSEEPVFTVFSAMKSSAATSAFDIPCASALSTWISRSLSMPT